MGIAARAAVVEIGGAGPVVQEIELAKLRHGEVLVRIVATGICHTDVAWAAGELFDSFPVVLGHESAGVVEAVGPGVRRVAPGDRVAVALTHHCGYCSYCESGRPMLCAERDLDRGRLWRDGQPLAQGFGTAAFAERAVVGQSSTIPVPAAVPLDVAAVVGCATSTGLGSVFNLAKVQYGSSVAVLGAGAIGLSVVMGCALAGAERIVVGDPNPHRRRLAAELGATDVVEPVEDAFREVSAQGFEYVFECVGRQAPMEQAIRLARRGGTITLIGAPPPDVVLRIDALDFVPSQRRILGCLTGNVRPGVDFERYFKLHSRGRLPLERLITARLTLDEIGTGFEMNRTCDGIRTIISVTAE